MGFFIILKIRNLLFFFGLLGLFPLPFSMQQTRLSLIFAQLMDHLGYLYTLVPSQLKLDSSKVEDWQMKCAAALMTMFHLALPNDFDGNQCGAILAKNLFANLPVRCLINRSID
jgi:hypothetical protein